MHPRLRSTLLLPLALLFGCAAETTPPGIGTSFTPVAGDYVITVAAGTASASYFTGDVEIVGTTASGVFRYTNPGAVCVSGSQDIPFTGSFSGTTLTLTSATFSNSVATLKITLPLTNNNIGGQVTTGTAVITGGTCALASGALQAQYYPPYTGTWQIALTSPTTQSATLLVNQSPANADGQYPTTATLTIGSTQTAMTGLVSGPSLNLANTGSTITLSANAFASPVSVSIGGNTGGTGTMTK